MTVEVLPLPTVVLINPLLYAVTVDHVEASILFPFASIVNTFLKNPLPVISPRLYVDVVEPYMYNLNCALALSVPLSVPSLQVPCASQAHVAFIKSLMVPDFSVTVAEFILQVSVSVVVYVILYIVLLVQFVLPEASFVHI